MWRKSQQKPQWRRGDAEPWYDEKGGSGDVSPPTREPGSDDGPPSGATQTCRFCDSMSVDISKDGKSAHCTDCDKGWSLGR